MDAVSSIAAIAAHRGWHVDGAPENGIAALEQAHARGADWVEVDIRRLGDGTHVAFHDPRMDGVPLHRLDRSVLRGRPEVPTLEAWSRRAGELGVGVLAELKDSGSEDEVVAMLRHNVGDRIDLMSFEPDTVRRLAGIAPDRPVGLLTYELPVTRRARDLLAPSTLPNAARRLGASFVGLNVNQATERMLAATQRAGLGTAVWTVDAPGDLARLLSDERVATVITDVPDTAIRLRSALSGAVDAFDGVRLLRAAATMR
jgi:glycerophosphoryl diester phosphodiesterase